MIKLAAEFKRGRESVEDDGWSGYYKDVNGDENFKLMHTLVICNRRRDMQSIASEVGITFGAVKLIPTNI